jgi:hypothetical protein
MKSIERVSPLCVLATPALDPAIQVMRASYRRPMPAQYQGNPHFHDVVEVNVLSVDGGSLVVPSSRETSFEGFYGELREKDLALFRHILSPMGTAKSASSDHITPIKAITQINLTHFQLPGDEALYGWRILEEEVRQAGFKLELFFQGNGLYYNRGSVIYYKKKMRAYPDIYLVEILGEKPSAAVRAQMAIDEEGIKRPLLFFCRFCDGQMMPYVHRFREQESYLEGMERLRQKFEDLCVRAALAASPPLILPKVSRSGKGIEPNYISFREMIRQFHANDVRHYLYCPYEGAVLLSAELSRMQGVNPGALARSLSGRREDRVAVALQESLNFVSIERLGEVLDQKGYADRYHFSTEDGQVVVHINLLEGVYSHLVVFLTRNGRLGIVQTSGTRGNITGNDGPTYRQLSAILRDINQQEPFREDPIVAAASGSQGNDVPNILCAAIDGKSGLLHELEPGTRLDEKPAPRGIVTTPRVGIAINASVLAQRRRGML